MEIIREDKGSEGRFVAMEQADELGEMTYRWLNDDQIIIDHTGVNPQYEGRGVGKALFMKAVAFAREKDIRIIPVCPFVKTMFKRFPETAEVLVK